jgi:hypothetical protein
VGFLDALFGGGKKLKAPAKDRLFAMTTAYVTMETEVGLKSKGAAAICFQQIGTADFKRLYEETEELLHGSAQDTGTEIETADDKHGYRWIGDRLLAMVFAFEDENGRSVYFIYNFKRGAYYPFVPTGSDEGRDNSRELQLKAQLEGELPMEQELTRWFPLWDIPL